MNQNIRKIIQTLSHTYGGLKSYLELKLVSTAWEKKEYSKSIKCKIYSNQNYYNCNVKKLIKTNLNQGLKINITVTKDIQFVKNLINYGERKSQLVYTNLSPKPIMNC